MSYCQGCADLRARLLAVEQAFAAYKVEHHDCVTEALDAQVAVHDEIEARRDGLEAKLKAVEQDAEWRHRWHQRLGRGEQAEGKFYESLEQRAALRARMRAMEGYVQHPQSCGSRQRRDYCRAHGGDGGMAGCPTCQNIPVQYPCSCGLTALLDLPVSETTTKEEDLTRAGRTASHTTDEATAPTDRGRT